MLATRAFSALVVGFLSSSSLALRTRQSEVPTDLVQRGLAAIGINSNTSDVRNVRIGGSQFRTKSIVTTIALDGMDQTVVPYGSQTITYSYETGSLKQRIDKVSGLGTLWMFARPELEPMDYSVVVQGGDDAFAAVVRGSYALFDPTAAPEGYLDGYLAAYMISDGQKWDPLLLSKISANDSTLRSEPVEGDLLLPAGWSSPTLLFTTFLTRPLVFDQALNMSIIFNPDTYLPFAIRTYEDHPFFGPSTNDLRVYDFISVNGLMIPRHYKTIYNNQRLCIDFLADDISVNTEVEPSLFDVPAERGELSIPVVDPALTAEIGEKYTNYIWFGRNNFTVESLSGSQPYADLPGVWVVRPPGVSAYRQILLETDTYVAVLDAPAEIVAVLLEWVRINIGKPVSQVWPTHHHHDHAFGVKGYVQNGAEIVCPKMAESYYADIPGAKFETFERGAPHIMETNGFRATFIHIEGSIHAQDHSVAVIMPACPTEDSTVVVFDADHVTQAQLMATHNDHNEIAQLVKAMVKHRVAKSAV
ncbi:uncharacterized protein J4E92_007785 [Alternaria infectoria]|uniref:uncharacterized protein n=1 Tax=Alternaria infectoria TaxID=45303 RepID=UPI0022206E6A|nr:uncharacterized protein J4E92_007785 [Alternaria infectoria]KAI4923034.1 hypothetical protein J4E92_007785 [Alternaria infectoria]